MWAVHLPNLSSPENSPCGWLPATVVKAAQAGSVIHIPEWEADPEWTLNGFDNSLGTLGGEVLYGSFSDKDPNRGALISSPFESRNKGCIILPIAHGPSIVGQSVSLVAADTGKSLGEVQLDQNNGNWRYWAIYFSREIPALRIVAEDRGDQLGQWVAIGEPHLCTADHPGHG